MTLCVSVAASERKTATSRETALSETDAMRRRFVPPGQKAHPVSLNVIVVIGLDCIDPDHPLSFLPPQVEELFEAAQAKLKSALTLIPEAPKEEEAAKKEGEAAADPAAVAQPDVALVRSQVNVAARVWPSGTYPLPSHLRFAPGTTLGKFRSNKRAR